MKKKEPKKEYSKNELDRHLGSMAERYHEDVKITREGFVTVTQILERMEKTLDDNTKTLKNHSNLLLHHSQVLDEHTKKFDSHTEQIGALLMDSTEIKSRLNKLQLDVSFDLDRKVDKKHFVDLELRMRKLEKA